MESEISEPPKHKPFQIHLSTAVVLMLLSGALLGANIKNWAASPTDREYGFPFRFYEHHVMRASGQGQMFQSTSTTLNILKLFGNVALLLPAAALSEYAVRTREKKK